MEKIRLGKTEMMVTRIGLGGIPIQRLSDDEAVLVIKKCLELGINYIDTANAYTTSEGRIGKAISGWRERLIIATKSGARTRDGVEAHLKLSLKQLGTDYIDLYQFHNIADADTLKAVLDPGGPMVLLQEAKKAGVVRHIGFTSHSLDIAREAVKTDCFETVMFGLNFLAPEAAVELLPLAREHDVGFIVMKPLAGGIIENATIAFKYFVQFPDVVVIPGIERRAEIEEITRIIEGPGTMSAAEQIEMQRIKREVGKTFCHRCDYCQPCTENIPISTVMTALSHFKRIPPQRFFSGRIGEALEEAASCSKCGNCEQRCPYHLPIMEMMDEKATWYQEEKRKYQTSLNSR